jgi:arsenate reductase-like glutaredoxin family protein
MKVKKDQITCIFASNSDLGQKLKAFLSSSNRKNLMIDICKTMPSDTQWHDISIRLNKSLGELMDLSRINPIENTQDFSEESWVKILANNPKTLIGAIIIEDGTVMHITNYTEILKFYNVDSAGLTKKQQGEKPLTKRQSDNDRFI